jgi:DNA-binding LytR/AlgR family response regulator
MELSAQIAEYKKEHNPYDIIFLDIEMDGLDGIETAKKIRVFDENVIIIYVTSHTQYVYDAFEVFPLRFLVKPVEYEKFKEIFLIAYEKLKKSKRMIYLNIDKKTVRINCSEIYYIESDKRILIFHTKDDTIRAYGKLNDYASQLYKNDFIQVHKSYLVNFNHVDKFSPDSLEISDGIIIPISEKNRRYVKEEHMKYIMRSIKVNVK